MKGKISDATAMTEVMMNQIDTLQREMNLILNMLTDKNYERLKTQLLNDFF
jgi:hypothetical protein